MMTEEEKRALAALLTQAARGMEAFAAALQAPDTAPAITTGPAPGAAIPGPGAGAATPAPGMAMPGPGAGAATPAPGAAMPGPGAAMPGPGAGAAMPGPGAGAVAMPGPDAAAAPAQGMTSDQFAQAISAAYTKAGPQAMSAVLPQLFAKYAPQNPNMSGVQPDVFEPFLAELHAGLGI